MILTLMTRMSYGWPTKGKADTLMQFSAAQLASPLFAWSAKGMPLRL